MREISAFDARNCPLSTETSACKPKWLLTADFASSAKTSAAAGPAPLPCPAGGPRVLEFLKATLTGQAWNRAREILQGSTSHRRPRSSEAVSRSQPRQSRRDEQGSPSTQPGESQSSRSALASRDGQGARRVCATGFGDFCSSLTAVRGGNSKLGERLTLFTRCQASVPASKPDHPLPKETAALFRSWFRVSVAES